ncbi:MAG: hypothetical protein M0021_07335 [Clostridia bacterium]|nr:hypothetical protein [Clostridia bacterium]
MANVLYLKEHKQNAKSSYSLAEMIFSPQKRKETYNYYDSHYEETEDEKKIFEETRKRRKR